MHTLFVPSNKAFAGLNLGLQPLRYRFSSTASTLRFDNALQGRGTTLPRSFYHDRSFPSLSATPLVPTAGSQGTYWSSLFDLHFYPATLESAGTAFGYDHLGTALTAQVNFPNLVRHGLLLMPASALRRSHSPRNRAIFLRRNASSPARKSAVVCSNT